MNDYYYNHKTYDSLSIITIKHVINLCKLADIINYQLIRNMNIK